MSTDDSDHDVRGADRPEIRYSTRGLEIVSSWMGQRRQDILRDTHDPEVDEQPRPGRLGLGAKFLSHKKASAGQSSGVEHKLNAKLKHGRERQAQAALEHAEVRARTATAARAGGGAGGSDSEDEDGLAGAKLGSGRAKHSLQKHKKVAGLSRAEILGLGPRRHGAGVADKVGKKKKKKKNKLQGGGDD